MGDTIGIDWGMAPQAPTQSPFNAFLAGFAGARQMSLAKTADEAKADALAHPDDVNAALKLSLYDPQAAQGLFAVQDRNRAEALRQAEAAAIPVLYGQNAFAPQPMGTQAPAQPPMGTQAPAAPANPATSLAPVSKDTPFNQAFAGMAPAPTAAQAQGVTPQAIQQLLSPQAPHMQAVGAAVSSGQMSVPEALANLARIGGDPAVSAMVDSVSKMDQMRRDKLDEANQALGTAAQQLLSVPQAQRAQMLTQMAPYLAQHGITTDQVQQAIAQGLSDQQLHGFVGQAIGVKGIIDQANKTRELGQADQRLGLEGMNLAETIRHNKVEEGKGVQDGFGNVVNPITGQVIYRQGETGGDTLASRNNNPGNIRDGAYARSLPGYVGSEGGFAKFETPEAGQAAQVGLLQNYIAKGFDTPAKIAARWAPAGDGNNPAQYAAALAQAAGIGVNDKVPPGKLQAIAQAQARIEGYGSGGGAGGLTDAAIQTAAEWAIANGGKMPQGYARNKAAQAAIQNRIAQVAQQRGMSVPDMIAGGAGIHADQASLAALEKQATTVRAAENAAQANAQLALNLAPAVANGNIQVFNAWKNHWNTSMGDPAVAKFAAALSTFSNEYATVMGRGMPTDSLRSEAHSIINSAQSPQQLQGVIATMQKDMANRRAGYEQERDATLSRIRGTGGQSPSPQTNPGAPADVLAIMRKHGVIR